MEGLSVYLPIAILWLGSLFVSFAAGYALRSYLSYRKHCRRYPGVTSPGPLL